MKKIIIMLLVITAACYSQQATHYSSEKWITTAVDTLQVGNQTIYPINIIVTADSLRSNLLQFRTDGETTWRTLMTDDKWFEYERARARYLYRRALKDSVYSRGWSN